MGRIAKPNCLWQQRFGHFSVILHGLSHFHLLAKFYEGNSFAKQLIEVKMGSITVKLNCLILQSKAALIPEWRTLVHPKIERPGLEFAFRSSDKAANANLKGRKFLDAAKQLLISCFNVFEDVRQI